MAGHVVHKFGRNNSVGNGTWEDIWTRGGAYVWPQVGGTLLVSSDSTADTSTGTGARTIVVEGLSTAFEPIQETISMLGTTTSTGTKNFRRINLAYVDTAGTYGGLFDGANTGTITINTSTGGAVGEIIASTGGGTVGFGETQLSMYTVPENQTATIRRIHLSADAGKAADVAMFQRRLAGNTTAPFSAKRLIAEFDAVQGEVDVVFREELGPFPERTDLWFAAKGSANDTEVSVLYEIVLSPEGRRTGSHG